MTTTAIRWYGVTVILTCVLVGGCSYKYNEPSYEVAIEKDTVLRNLKIDRDLEDKILALNPDNVSEQDVREVLAHGPAPRIINIHGGIPPVFLEMESFGKFLIAMGYPESKIRDPRGGAYSFSCYDISSLIAGTIAWYYEHEGMRPMVIGHSQGGMQVVKVLHDLAGSFGESVSVRSPVGKSENRDWIIDPFTGDKRPVVGLDLVSYASAVGAGGPTRIMPNQWSMGGRLRNIPDTCEEFTGFYLTVDLIGGDWGPAANSYKPIGRAQVRNVLLPAGYDHYFVPRTAHLANHEDSRAWIYEYQPTERPEQPQGLSDTANILWAADVWGSVKKHWCIEAQRLIRARRGVPQIEPLPIAGPRGSGSSQNESATAHNVGY